MAESRRFRKYQKEKQLEEQKRGGGRTQNGASGQNLQKRTFKKSVTNEHYDEDAPLEMDPDDVMLPDDMDWDDIAEGNVQETDPTNSSYI